MADHMSFFQDLVGSNPCTDWIRHGTQPVFVLVANGQWLNTNKIDEVLLAGNGLIVVSGNQTFEIPDSETFWKSQTVTPGY